MAEFAIIVMIIVGLSAVGLLLLAFYLGWKVLQLVGRIIGAVFRGIGNGLGWVFGVGRKHVENHVHCSRPACGEANPVSAQFCRRCGRSLKVEFVPAGVAEGHRVPPPIPGAALGSR